jgi:SAM-dependent methyltransferase
MTPATASAVAAALELFDPARRPAEPDVAAGYVDLLGADDPTGSLPGQRLMISTIVPRIYERWWRPLGARLFMGALGPGMRDEHDVAVEMLGLSGADTVLDVACGTGAFTREFARAAPRGLAVGLDASRPMLAQAVAAEGPENVAYVRGDAHALPFRDGAFDAVCCFAALYFIEEPFHALDEMVRVLRPGGRLALMTSVARGVVPAPVADAVVRPLTGVRMFGREELTGHLRDRAFTAIEQRVSGLAQFVAASAPPR